MSRRLRRIASAALALTGSASAFFHRSQLASACTSGTPDCLQYNTTGAAGSGDVVVNPKVYIYCPGWNCTDHTVDNGA